MLEKAEVRRLARDVGSTAVSRISHVALNSTDNIIISTMLGTVCVGQLSNYTFIADSLTGILCLITAALTPSLGNYFVEKSREESYSLFRSLTYANLWLYALATAAMLTLFNPFVTVWLHNPDYLLSAACAVAISLNFFVAGYMTTLFTFRSSLGLFSQGWFRPIVVSVLNIGLSVLLAFLWRDATFLGTGDWGLFGVLIATTLSRLLVNVWYDPIIIHRYGFGVSARPFFLRLLRMVGEVAVLCGLLACVKLLLPVTLALPRWEACLRLAALFLITAAVLIAGFWLFNRRTPEFRHLVAAVKSRRSRMRRSGN